MLNTPILFIIFNRPDTTKVVFEAIRKARPERLYIAADAPRSGKLEDIEKCMQAKSITEEIDWPCEVKRLYQEMNLGCSMGPITALKWFFSTEKEGIILEDDCLPHPDFFAFASQMLHKYRNNKSIISVNGSNLGYTLSDNNSYFFSRFMNMWGWATWADRASEIDYRISHWKTIKYPLFFLYTRLKQDCFDTDINWYKYWKEKFDLTVNNDIITWWDWQWIFHQLYFRKLSIVPSANLVTNIGFNEEATHTLQSHNPAANIPFEAISFPLNHPTKIKPDYRYEESCLKWVWCYHKRLPTTFYIKQFISSLLLKKEK